MIEIPSAGNMWRKALLAGSAKELREFEEVVLMIDRLAGEGKAFITVPLLAEQYKDLLRSKGYQVIIYTDHLEVRWSPT